MAELSNSLSANTGIILSRNTPVAIVVGVAGFLGSHLAEELLRKNIQVIGIDNFLTGHKRNIEELIKSKHFHFVNQSVAKPLLIKPPRLDYAFFVADAKSGFERGELYRSGLASFLEWCAPFSPKVVLTSSIALYSSKTPRELRELKNAEIHLAKFTKEHKLNARVVRLAPLFGPRMHFREDDPVIRLIQAGLLGELQNETTSLDFSSRDLFIDDAVKLVMKTMLAGSTSQKIYDGALIQPIKVTEIKQVLLDPLWYEGKGFEPTELPPWHTPNLLKTSKELSWKPGTHLVKALKETVTYFKENNIEVPPLGSQELEREAKEWVMEEKPLGEVGESEKKLEPAKIEDEKEKLKNERRAARNEKVGEWKRKFITVGLILLVGYALLWPFVNIAWGAFTIQRALSDSGQQIQTGNFDKALNDVNSAQNSLNSMSGFLSYLAILKKVNIAGSQIDSANELVLSLEGGMTGAKHAVTGSQYLFQAAKIISGESNADPKALYQNAQTELTSADSQMGALQAELASNTLLKGLPGLLQPSVSSLRVKVDQYANLIEKGSAVSSILPQITAVGGKKSYLVLLENNLELRPGGGFIGSYARLDFANGKIGNIVVDDIYNLDGQLKVHVEPPPEIKNDLGQNNYYLRDSNFEPDFPTSAREAEFFYNQEAGTRVNGVISLDLAASGKLLDAVGGVDLTDYSEHVDSGNLFAKAMSHAESGFFPGSQAKKNYLTSLENTLFDKIFFLSKQNWPGIVQALSDSLDQKHVMVYMDDPTLLSSITGANWGGVLPRQMENQTGETNDFLATVDANLGADKANYYLNRSFLLETSFGKDGQIYHSLKITYENTSPSSVFPAGPYKNRLRVYLPSGTKLTKADFGEQDITSQVTSFSDYGRTGYSMLINVSPKEKKVLSLEYQLATLLNFDSNNKTNYKLNIVKEAGTNQDPFVWNVTYPINFNIFSLNGNSVKPVNQEVDLSSNLLTDRTFTLGISK